MDLSFLKVRKGDRDAPPPDVIEYTDADEPTKNKNALLVSLAEGSVGGGGAGDASASNQDEQTALLTDIETGVDGVEALLTTIDGRVDGLETLETAGNASLSSIDTKTPALGQALAAASTPVVLPAAQITTLTPPAAITGFATSAKQDTLQTAVDSVNTKTPALGQAVAGSSTPVVLTAAEEAQLGSLTEAAPASDTASSGLNGRLQRIAQRITSLIALLPTSLGAKTAANSFAVTTATDDAMIALHGIVTEAAPASDTASSGLNGRLQRIAQRITSLIALYPTSLGAKTAANSFAVTLATDDAAVATLGAVADATVAAGATGSISAKLRRVTQGLEDLKTLIVLGAGTNYIGRVGGTSPMITVTPAVQASAYAIGDVLFVATVVTNAMRANDVEGFLQTIYAISKNGDAPELDLYFYDAAVTIGTINAAVSISDADNLNYMGKITIEASDWDDMVGSKVADKVQLARNVKPATGTRNIYMAGVTRTVITPATTSDFVFRLGFAVD